MFAIAKSLFFFFFNDTATTEIYTLSLHDALPISHSCTRACEIRHAGAHLATNLRCSVAFRSRLGYRRRGLAPGPADNNMHVLLVEDNALVASGVRAGLQLQGFGVDTVASAGQAAAAIRSSHFDA